jgi:hypothetical protein
LQDSQYPPENQPGELMQKNRTKAKFLAFVACLLSTAIVPAEASTILFSASGTIGNAIIFPSTNQSGQQRGYIAWDTGLPTDPLFFEGNFTAGSDAMIHGVSAALQAELNGNFIPRPTVYSLIITLPSAPLSAFANSGEGSNSFEEYIYLGGVPVPVSGDESNTDDLGGGFCFGCAPANVKGKVITISELEKYIVTDGPELPYFDRRIELDWTGSITFSGSLPIEDLGKPFGVEILATAIPEPSTWAMMLVGFAAIGFALRKQDQNRQPSLRLS